RPIEDALVTDRALAGFNCRFQRGGVSGFQVWGLAHEFSEQRGRALLGLRRLAHLQLDNLVLRDVDRIEWDEDFAVEAGSHRHDGGIIAFTVHAGTASDPSSGSAGPPRPASRRSSTRGRAG